jgi:hypothetical protein
LIRHDPRATTQLTENLPLNPDSTEDNIVLIAPQAATVSVRPLDQSNEGHRVEFEIAQSSQYPVDLYFLLDLSWSMEDSRATFAEQGGEIIAAIKEISSNVHIGFGSFVDKNLPPFTSSVSSFNCPKENPHCTPPYSYYHQTTMKDYTAQEFKVSSVTTLS